MIATTASATAATRFHRVLKQHDIFSDIMATPAYLAKGGCSYSLRIAEDTSVQKIVWLATQNNIKVRGIWMETGNKDMPYQKIYG